MEEASGGVIDEFKVFALLAALVMSRLRITGSLGNPWEELELSLHSALRAHLIWIRTGTDTLQLD